MMNYALKVSLEHIAFVKLIVALWSQQDIQNLIAKYSFPLSEEQKDAEWQPIENMVKEKMLQLPLPAYLKNKALGFVKPIGMQILTWWEYHGKCYFCINTCSTAHRKKSSVIDHCTKFPNKLCWTSHGTINRKKTAEILIKDNSLSVITRYTLACTYCFEDDILNLWDIMPANCRKFVFTEKYHKLVPIIAEKYHDDELILLSNNNLVVFWMYYVKKTVCEVDHIFQTRFSSMSTTYGRASFYAAAIGNKVAMEYFFEKIKVKEKEESLLDIAQFVANNIYIHTNSSTFPKDYYTDVLCFLFSQMDEEQQMEIFKYCSYTMLQCFIDWPWQCFFMKTASLVWNYLSKNEFLCILLAINKKVTRGDKDWNYQKLFDEFWHESPEDHKEYAINECTTNAAFSKILNLIKI